MENLPEKHAEDFQTLLGQQLKVGRAWTIKEPLRELGE